MLSFILGFVFPCYQIICNTIPDTVFEFSWTKQSLVITASYLNGSDNRIDLLFYEELLYGVKVLRSSAMGEGVAENFFIPRLLATLE